MTQPGRELNVLAQTWGQPRMIERQIPVAPGLRQDTVHDFFSERWGEVVMVVRRAGDGRVWVMTKESFPHGLYSLPTGGIRPGESIAAALWRELGEETGFDARMERFLATIRYEPILASGDPQGVPCFFSYVFLLEELNGAEPAVTGGERILDFKAVLPAELLAIERQWSALSGSSDEFHDLAAWGIFRSIVHQAVWEALARAEVSIPTSIP